MLTTTEEEATWTAWCEANGVHDLYWSWEHLALWAGEWDAWPLGVRWTGSGGSILHPVLLVPLDRLEGGQGLLDVRTAYDFGGPRYVEGKDPLGAMSGFELDWSKWCLEHQVVTEFLRLHPTALPIRPSFASFHADHYTIDLDRSYEEIRASYRSAWRSPLRQGEAWGSRISVSGDPGELELNSFLELYVRTMERVDAGFEFRFGSRTLRRLLGLSATRLATVWTTDGRPAAHAVLLVSGSVLFYHLSCSDPAHLPLRPNHLLLDAAVRYGWNNGYRAFHLGGGKPSLRHFKAGMGGGTLPYYVVRRVSNPHAYSTLCAANGVDPEGQSFPAYIRRFSG